MKEKIFFLGAGIINFYLLLCSSSIINIPNFYLNILFITGMLLLLLKMFLQRYTKKTFLLTILLGITVLYPTIICKDFTLIITFAILFSIQDVKIEKMLKLLMYINIPFILIHSAIYFIDFAQGNLQNVFYNAKNEIRHYMYMGQPNYISQIFFWTIFGILYIRYEKIKNIDLIISFLLTIIVYLLTKSRTIFIISVLGICIIILAKVKKKDKNNIIERIAKYSFSVIGIISLILSKFYYDIMKFMPFIKKVNEFLTGRIGLGYIALEEYGVAFLSKYIDYSKTVIWGNNYKVVLIVDNLYIRLAVSYGVFFGILLAIGFYIVSKKVNTKKCIFIIIFAIIGFSERHILNALYGFPLLFIGDYILNKNAKKGNDE